MKIWGVVLVVVHAFLVGACTQNHQGEIQDYSMNDDTQYCFDTTLYENIDITVGEVENERTAAMIAEAIFVGKGITISGGWKPYEIAIDTGVWHVTRNPAVRMVGGVVHIYIRASDGAIVGKYADL